MPATDPRSEFPRGDWLLDESADRWTIPLCRMAGTQFGISYTVFIAAAILLAVVLTLASRPGNSDIVQTTTLGTAFWLSGWLVQVLTHFLLAWILGLRLRRLSFGLLGVESTSRNWRASMALAVAIAALASLLLLGGLYRLIEGGFRMPTFLPDGGQSLSVPSIGFQSHDSIWFSGAWLCWVQAICQMYPLPRTLGRQVIGALAGMVGGHHDIPTQAMIFRRCIVVLAACTVLAAIFLMSEESGRAFPQWPLVALLGVLLWLSSRASDVTTMLIGFQSTAALESGEGLVSRIRSRIRSGKEQKRLQRAIEQERSEAVDAARLDEILNRLHAEGIESLSDEERQILDRVSKNLRQQREAEGGDPPNE